MTEDALLPFAFPPVQLKKLVAAFDGGRLTSDGGVMLLAAAERRLGIVDKLAVLIADPRDPALVTHSLADILRARTPRHRHRHRHRRSLSSGRQSRTRGTPPPPAPSPCCCGLRQNSVRPGVRGHIRRIARRIRAHWPHTKLTFRGDSHYGRHEAMAWCESNGVDYIFGLGGNDVLDRQVEEIADDVRVRHAEGEAPLVRRYAETSYGAKSWKCPRRVSARIEAGCNGLDIRYVVTNITRGSAEWLYDVLYCERGQAENLIKLHKSQLASDRTSCRSPLANQVRLLLHTAAYWLLLAVRDAIPKPQPLARAEFTTLRLRLIKIAARVIETATRVRIAFAASHPRGRAIRRHRALAPARRAVTRGAMCPRTHPFLQPQRPPGIF